MIYFVRRLRWFAITVALAGTAGLGLAQAQVLVTRDPFGQGVNAYFAGRSSDADAFLSFAIGADAENPAAYFFRALARLRLGRDCEAKDDMQIGAALEAARPHSRTIGKLLEPVQGQDRLLLEKYRSESRANASYIRESLSANAPSSITTKASLAPAGSIAGGDTDVLRQRIVVPLDELLRAGGPRAVPAGLAQNWPDVPPRSASAATPSAASEPQSNTQAAEDNPFEDDAAETPGVAPSSPPASAPAGAEVKPAAPSEPPPAADDNPFENL